MTQRFTAYRRQMSERDTHNELQKNADDQPQYEGVIWSDGTCTLRWLTAAKSTSMFDSFQAMINVHGHPEYGTEIVFHDGEAPQAWIAALVLYGQKLEAEDSDLVLKIPGVPSTPTAIYLESKRTGMVARLLYNGPQP